MFCAIETMDPPQRARAFETSPAGQLWWRTYSVAATTHRGEYQIWLHRDCVAAYFHEHGTGGCVALGARGPDGYRDVEAACKAHAARQPAHPPTLSWPAGYELPCEVAHVEA